MQRQARLLVVAAFSAVLLYAAFPRLLSVEPDAATPGDEVTAKGQNVGKGNVTKLFLTGGGKDIEVQVKEQTDESLRFVVPTDIKLGNYNLMIQTGGAQPALMEQPVVLEVADAETVAKKLQEEKELETELSRSEEPVEEAPAEAGKPEPK